MLESVVDHLEPDVLEEADSATDDHPKQEEE
jgi:hypothetical protein